MVTAVEAVATVETLQGQVVEAMVLLILEEVAILDLTIAQTEQVNPVSA